MHKTGDFVTSIDSKPNDVTLGTYEIAHKFEIKKSLEKTKYDIFVQNKPNMVFNIKGNITDLIYYPHSNAANERFNIIITNLEKAFQIYNKLLCLEYKDVDKKFVLTDCVAANNKQLFEFLDVDKFDTYMLNNGDPSGNPSDENKKEQPKLDKSQVEDMNNDSLHNLIKDLHNSILGRNEHNLFPYYNNLGNLYEGYNNFQAASILDLKRQDMLLSNLVDTCLIL